MSVEADPLHEDLISWVRDWNEQNDQRSDVRIDADTPLMSSGLLNSMGMVAFVVLMEERTGGQFDYESYVPGASDSIRGLLEHCVK